MKSISALMVASLLLVHSSVHAAPGDILNLGTFGGTFGRATSINDAGVIVGYASDAAGVNHAFSHTGFAGKTLTNLSSAYSLEFRADGINNRGQISGAGYLSGSSLAPAAFIASAGMPPSLVPVAAFSHFGFSEGHAINDTGVIAGRYTEGNGGYIRAFVQSGGVNGGYKDLGTLGGPFAAAFAINNRGHIVGVSQQITFTFPTFIYDATSDGPMVSLGLHNDLPSFATGINDNDIVVGYSFTQSAPEYRRGFKKNASNPTSAFADLSAVGGVASYALGINDLDVIVGSASTIAEQFHATLWMADNKAVDLDTWLDSTNPALGSYWTLLEATAINDHGIVVGYGNYNDGPGGLRDGELAFALDASSFIPVPEPSIAPFVPMVFWASTRWWNRPSTSSRQRRVVQQS